MDVAPHWHPCCIRHVTDSERRTRLATRHALVAPLDSPESATRALTVLHATEPASVYLSLWARVAGLTVDDVDRARGNAGTTAWVDGRAVGCWARVAAGVVSVHLLEEVHQHPERC